jgi:UDP-glucose 4-epimerase
MRVLVTGGAGYIGSHMVKLLLEEGADVVTFDNLSSGRRGAVTGGSFVEGDLNDPELLRRTLTRQRVDAVMHFASLIQVGESVREPARYYETNVTGTLNLLSAMRETGVHRFVFSSSAAVFGEPQYTPIDEAHPKAPINPYGFSKWIIERVLADYAHAHGIASVSLRYFNAAGADPGGELGECHDPETHLIPLVLQAVAGRRDSVTVYGADYPTADGTCVRDYVHVADLCRAHLLALERLASHSGAYAYNLGNGKGFSVKQIVEAAERVTGMKVPVVMGARRPGDPAVLVADSKKAVDELGWRPAYQALDTIISHAWAWERKTAGAAEEIGRVHL